MAMRFIRGDCMTALFNHETVLPPFYTAMEVGFVAKGIEHPAVQLSLVSALCHEQLFNVQELGP